MKFLLSLWLMTFLASCNSMVQPEATKKTMTYNLLYYEIGDIESCVKISHQECTECIDAYVDSGEIYLTTNLKVDIDSIFKNTGICNIPDKHDLYLIDDDTSISPFNKINSELFGNQNNYQTKWNNRYLITGKVIGIKGHGFIFNVKRHIRI